MSSTCTSGRQGDPSLSRATVPVVMATAVKIVHDDVEAQPRGESVGRGVTKIGRD